MKSETYEYICAVYALARKVCYSMNAQARRLPVKAFQAGCFVGWRTRRLCAFANGSSYVPCNKPISCVQQYLPCEFFLIVHPKLHWNLNVFHWKYITFAFSLLRSLNATSALYILYKSKGAWLLWYADAPHYNAIIYTRLNLDSSHPCWRTRAHQWSSIKHTHKTPQRDVHNGCGGATSVKQIDLLFQSISACSTAEYMALRAWCCY